MARRKDHSPQELKTSIRVAAEKIIYTKGLVALTARRVAEAVGYTPGTIYNLYRDMDALVTEVNYTTLTRLDEFCRERLKRAGSGYAAVKSLAYAYIDFAAGNERAWRTLFIETNRVGKPGKLPAHYQERLAGLFQMLETTLKDNLAMDAIDAASAARILWAALHGITSLTLDGRLSLIGVEDPHDMTDDLLDKYLKTYIRG
jgi:AcrR family transcriptional regulator